MEKNWFQRLFDRIHGDKVMWIVVILLYLVSILAIFSSTSMNPEVRKGLTTRVSLFVEQLILVGVCLAILFGCYKIKNLKFYKYVGMASFWISFVLLTILDLHLNLGFIKAQRINHAWRSLSLMGLQIHVFEVVKVLMMLYLAWAVNAWTLHDFPLVNKLYAKHGWKILQNDWFLSFLFIFFPIMIVSGMVILGSGSSAIFIAGMMFLTLLIGGLNFKHIVTYIGIALTVASIVIGLHVASDGKILPELRVETWANRFNAHFEEDVPFDEEIARLGRNTTAGQKYIDKSRQEIGSKIAVHEGGIIGKLPGNSTQKYKVPLMFGDYMYSFIIEEYGLFGAVALLILFLSLLSRGTLIAKHCDNIFARTAVGGICVTISSQAIMHMMINVGLLPMTGQTLPMISDGKSSLLMFSIALGVVLSISRMVEDKISREQAEALTLAGEKQETDDDGGENVVTASEIVDQISEE